MKTRSKNICIIALMAVILFSIVGLAACPNNTTDQEIPPTLEGTWSRVAEPVILTLIISGSDFIWINPGGDYRIGTFSDTTSTITFNQTHSGADENTLSSSTATFGPLNYTLSKNQLNITTAQLLFGGVWTK